ncbi:MAG: hypothetical protein H0X50_02900, partial [Nitrosopumilus sp.]|nr:hypothetical protein [Nitrosopumilus sp.]
IRSTRQGYRDSGGLQYYKQLYLVGRYQFIHTKSYLEKLTGNSFNHQYFNKTMTEGQQNNNSNNPSDITDASISKKEEEEEQEKKKKLLIEEKQPEEQLPVGEGHETEVVEENKG